MQTNLDLAKKSITITEDLVNTVHNETGATMAHFKIHMDAALSTVDEKFDAVYSFILTKGILPILSLLCLVGIVIFSWNFLKTRCNKQQESKNRKYFLAQQSEHNSRTDDSGVITTLQWKCLMSFVPNPQTDNTDVLTKSKVPRITKKLSNCPKNDSNIQTCLTLVSFTEKRCLETPKKRCLKSPRTGALRHLKSGALSHREPVP